MANRLHLLLNHRVPVPPFAQRLLLFLHHFNEMNHKHLTQS